MTTLSVLMLIWDMHRALQFCPVLPSVGSGIAMAFGNHCLQMTAVVAAPPNEWCRGLDLEVSIHPVMRCPKIYGLQMVAMEATSSYRRWP